MNSWELWTERYLRTIENQGYARRTIGDRAEQLGAFARYAAEGGVEGPEGLTGALLADYGRWRAERTNQWGRRDAPTTLANHLKGVRQFVRFLEEVQVVPAGISRHMPRLRLPDRLPGRIPSDEEVRRIFSAIDASSRVAARDRAILEVLYATGLRRMELLALGTADVDLESGLVRVNRGKGGKGRVVPLGREAAGWLRRYLLTERPKLLGGATSDALWVSMQGCALSVPGLQKLVREAVTRAGLSSKITPHAFRRACATEMVRAGAPLWPVKELLGHARLETLRRYARLTINDVREAHRKYHPRESQRGPGGPGQ